MSKYKVGDRVLFPYGSGGEGVIVGVKRILGLSQYVVLDDWYTSIAVTHKYFGHSLVKVSKPVTPNSMGEPREYNKLRKLS